MNRQQRRAAARGKQVEQQPASMPIRYDGDAGKGKVMVAVPTGRHPDASFMRDLLFLHVHDAKNHGRIVNGGSYMQKPGANVAGNRNQLVRKFLEGGWEWLWFIDDDMTFEPDIVDRLLEVADPVERPIVGGLCFSWHAADEVKVKPTIYMLGEVDGEPKPVSTMGYPRDQLVEVFATGSGCLLVHRRVFIELAKRWNTPFPWFAWSDWGHAHSQWGKIPGTEFEYGGPGDSLSEDITFCIRARSAMGNRDDYDGGGETFPVFVDTRIKVGHRKTVEINEDEYALRHPMAQGTPPTFVVIPVKGEHHYTESLLKQLAAQKGYQRIFVYDNGADSDPYTGFVPDNCDIIPAAGLTIHQMWNLGVKASKARYLACNIAILNNDLNIGPRFLEGLAEALRAHAALWVVSPNYDGRDFPTDVAAVKGIAAGRMDGTGGMAGFAFMVKGELFDHGLPLFDEQFELWYGDNDFAMTVDGLGGVIGIVKGVTVEHIDGGSKTAGDGTSRLRSPEYRGMAARDKERFETKWELKVRSA